MKDVKDELRDGDQILVKVLAIEGNRIKLSRKAVLREQRAKLGLPEVAEQVADAGRGRPERPSRPQASAPEETIVIGGDDFDDDDDELDGEGDEESAEEGTLVSTQAAQPRADQGGDRGQAGNPRRRRRRGRRPGGNAGVPQGGGTQ